MKEITNLDEMYNVLEEINTKNFSDIKNSLKNFLMKTAENRKIWCEYTCLLFRIANGELKGLLVCENENKEKFSIPNLDDFTEDDLKYIEKRMENTENDLLKLRYSTILCNKYPHVDKAKIIIDSSGNLICNLEQEILQNNKIDSFFLIIIINSYRYSFKFNYDKDRIKSKIIDLINNKSFWNKDLYLIPCGLIEHVLSEKKNFKGIDNLNDICWNIYKNIQSLNIWNKIKVLELGKKCDSKSHKYNWKMELGKLYEKEMEESEDPNLKAYHCLNASVNYKKAGKIRQSEDLLKKYREFPQEFKYSTFYGEIEHTPELIEEIIAYADSIVEQNEPTFILMYLMKDPRLTEYYENSLSFVEKSKEDFPLLHIFPIALRDENGFVIEKINPGIDRDNHATMEYYNWLIKFIYLPFISRIINTSYITGKLSPRIILEFLRDKTWLGLDEIHNVGKNDFLSMIVPIINNYFQEFELTYLYNIPAPHFSLFIDSLILKIEGILKLIYGIDNEIKEQKENVVTQDKSLNKILEDKNFDFIPEDELFFLKYLLIDKSGLNLRNKVAHSLMRKEDYNIGNANLLLLALLKLCSFQLYFNDKTDKK